MAKNATFSITDQTGGVDGSIHFELDRAENIGDGLIKTHTEYSGQGSKYISNADVIAIGAAYSAANCGGPLIPIRGGRVDAKEAGKPGVPEPEQDLPTHIEKFRHTLGGVESKDFPTIVDHPSSIPNGESISFSFDNTVTLAFDATVVSQYLDNTTPNPLVVTKNVTMRSDGNVTMKALSDPTVFLERCAILLERMINTVPAGVQLTEPIQLIKEKPHFYTGLVVVNGTLTFATSLRLARSISKPSIPGSRVSLHWCDGYGDNANCQAGFSNRIKGSPGAFTLPSSPYMVGAQREFRIYPFHAPIDPSRSASRFWWEFEQDDNAAPIKVDNNGAQYPLAQDKIFYVTAMSRIINTNNAPNGIQTKAFMVAAPTRVYLNLFDYTYETGRLPGTVTDVTFDLERNSTLPSMPGYTLYSALIEAVTGAGPTFDFHVDADGKTVSLPFQSRSLGSVHPVEHFIVDFGTVEKVPYAGATPTSAAVMVTASVWHLPLLFAWGFILVNRLFLSSLFFSTPCIDAYEWPGDLRYETLERFIYEGVRPDGIGMFGILGNCTLIPRANIQSTTTAATWLRMAYHDSATFNITDQTGGIDGSIHFELDRPENIGDGLKRTQEEYSGHGTKYVSNADVIAIGAAGAVANCGGPLIPIRGGRVDGKVAGNPGVPEPHQDLQTHIEKFRLQGFNATEMIELVACGHTLGGVESKDFPDIVDLRTGSFDFDTVSAPFDNTTAFDTAVVSQYLDGRTQNPLVVGKNVTTQSDLRIFNSDGNVTMRALADPSNFQKRCGILLEKMINTVPAGVKLTEPIDVISAKPHFFTGLHLVDNALTFATSLRLAQPQTDPFVDGSRVSLHWCDRYGDDANCQSGFSNRIKGTSAAFRMAGSPFMVRSEKDFRIYPFHAPIDPARSISRFWWEIEQPSSAESIKVDNEGTKYPLVQDQLVYVTKLSHVNNDVFTNVTGIIGSFSMVVGVRDGIEPSKVYLDIFDYAYTGRTPGSVTNASFDLVHNSSLPAASGYRLYSVAFDIVHGTGATFDFHVEANGKRTSLTLQPISFGSLIPNEQFVVDLGNVERVSYTGPPAAAIPPQDQPISSGVIRSLEYPYFGITTPFLLVLLTSAFLAQIL
ncbi:hypothetical protein CVT24_011287 [Panaeolus cyanescens]|uniref:Peroxidase n=1 Tax=Panaeolus cyanescens TaxID=181874 RepID=A0A409YUS9_9AGAR|nr:hypothetical protein CVT24_011287 [Panaeolus cyanescens]